MKAEKKKKLNIVWPTAPYWTINELHKFGTNSEFVEITLRSQLQKSIEQGKVISIGEFKGKIGRPRNVYAKFPVTSDVLHAADREGILVLYSNV